jgi:hypothetical protein
VFDYFEHSNNEFCKRLGIYLPREKLSAFQEGLYPMELSVTGVVISSFRGQKFPAATQSLGSPVL